jgi:hypothetical protein
MPDGWQAPRGEPAQKVPTGGPRVHWIEVDGVEPEISLVLPRDWLIVIESVSVRTSADGNGDVWIVYTLAADHG